MNRHFVILGNDGPGEGIVFCMLECGQHDWVRLAKLDLSKHRPVPHKVALEVQRWETVPGDREIITLDDMKRLLIMSELSR